MCTAELQPLQVGYSNTLRNQFEIRNHLAMVMPDEYLNRIIDHFISARRGKKDALVNLK